MKSRVHQSSRAGRVHAWLELVRAPNLLSVPGDPLAGAALAAVAAETAPDPRALCAVVGASLCLYAFGLILNDLRDLAEDRRDRPERPLPRGAVGMRAARVAAVLLAAAGLVFSVAAGTAPGLVGLALLAAIVLYDTVAKGTPAAPLVMGSCRGLSFLLGGAVGGFGRVVWIAAVTEALYITAVTVLARGETRAQRYGGRAYAPALILVTGLLVLFGMRLEERPPVVQIAVLLIAAGCAVQVGRAGRRLGRGVVEPAVTQPTIGLLIRTLMLWQSALLMLAGWWPVSLCVLAAWGVAHPLGRRFSPS